MSSPNPWRFLGCIFPWSKIKIDWKYIHWSRCAKSVVGNLQLIVLLLIACMFFWYDLSFLIKIYKNYVQLFMFWSLSNLLIDQDYMLIFISQITVCANIDLTGGQWRKTAIELNKVKTSSLWHDIKTGVTPWQENKWHKSDTEDRFSFQSIPLHCHAKLSSAGASLTGGCCSTADHVLLYGSLHNLLQKV